MMIRKTEQRNPRSTHIDTMSTREMVDLIASENQASVDAVQKAAPAITEAVERITASMDKGGRLFFIGAGTSGRLGIMDAAECPPTFGVPHDLIVGIIAGGQQSVFRAQENKEDSAEAGWQDLEPYNLGENDVVVGISAAGGAAYVIGALRKAKSVGATAIALTCNEGTLIGKESDLCIVTDTGAEVITGSTRMKAGTAHKMVLNILTTCAMVKQGKVYENMMINLRPTNEKLVQRMISIVCEILHCSREEAQQRLEKNEWNIRRAIETA